MQESILFPEIKPYNEGMLTVSDLHQIHYSEYGNPNGKPAIWLHGGPGAGCSDTDARYFDPDLHRIILLDQRGSGKSTPFCELEENTTQDLIADLEKLRTHLNIDKWLIVGGSWGTCLALLYSIAHSDKVAELVLRGIFTGTQGESQNLWYGMRSIFPDAWQELYDFLPENERDNLPLSYYKRITNQDPKISLPAIKEFIKYDTICAYTNIPEEVLKAALEDEAEMVAMARIFAHFDHNKYFIEDNYIMKNLDKIKHIKCIVVHGRYDIICRLQIAYDLCKNWDNADLRIIEMAGHTKLEPAMSQAIVDAIEDIKTDLA